MLLHYMALLRSARYSGDRAAINMWPLCVQIRTGTCHLIDFARFARAKDLWGTSVG